MGNFEVVTDEVTGEIKAVKIGDVELTPEKVAEYQKNEAAYKALQGEFTKRNQAYAEQEKELEEYRKFDKVLEEKPEIAEQIQALLAGTSKVELRKDAKDGDIAAKQALEKIERLEKALEEKEKAERIQGIYNETVALINKELDAQGITNQRIRKAVISDQMTELMRRQMSKEELAESVKSLAAEFKKLSSEELEALKKAGTKKQPVVPGKGGYGGITNNDKRPAMGTPEWRQFIAIKRQEHFSSE